MHTTAHARKLTPPRRHRRVCLQSMVCHTSLSRNLFQSRFVSPHTLRASRYLETLGLLASSSSVTVRQDLTGGSYALLSPPAPSSQSWLPLPDYWAALSWKALVGQIVFPVVVDDATSLGVYSMCLRSNGTRNSGGGDSGGIVVLAVNKGDSSVDLDVRLTTGSSSSSSSSSSITNATCLQLAITSSSLGSKDVTPPDPSLPLHYHQPSITTTQSVSLFSLPSSTLAFSVF